MNASFVTRFDEKLHVGVHEGNGHSDVAPVRKYEFRMVAEFLDETEDVILESELFST